MSKDRNEIQLTLNSIEELFAEPAADPFDPKSRYLSGIDEVVGQMRLRRRDLGNPSRLAIRLPKTAISADLQSNLAAALARYCAAKIAENRQFIAELRVGSHRSAISALMIVVVLFLFVVFLVMYFPELQTISGAIAGFVGIAVWVILWDPIYNYVYAWRPNRLDVRVYENLQTAEIEIEGT